MLPSTQTKEQRMPEDLATAIKDYFAGKNSGDFAGAVSGFSRSAVVKDEGQSHRGPAAIRAWMEETTAKYNDKAKVRSVASQGDKVEVLTQVSGTFPGSPIMLRFMFTLDGDQISLLEIAS
jgi:hypothetical protein